MSRFGSSGNTDPPEDNPMMRIIKSWVRSSPHEETPIIDPNQKTFFNDLPCEIILKIFGNIDIFILRKFRTVCKLWNDLILDDSLYRKFRFTCDVKKKLLLSVMYTKAHAFKHVYLDDMFDDDEWDEFKYIIDNSNLESLTLCMADNPENLVTSVLKKQKLKSFSMFDFEYETMDLNGLLGLLGPSHQRIKVYVTEAEAPGVIKLSELRINELHLNSIPFQPSDILPFCTLNAQNLTKFKLTGRVCSFLPIWNADDEILGPLAQCVNLKSLTLGQEVLEKASDRGLRRLQNLKLESVSFQRARFSSTAWIEFLKKMNTLKKIGLLDCDMVDSHVLRAIASYYPELMKFVYTNHWPGVDHVRDPDLENDLLLIVENCTKLKVLRVLLKTEAQLHLLNKLVSADSDLDEIVYICAHIVAQDSAIKDIEERMKHETMLELYGPDGSVMLCSFKKDVWNRIIRNRVYERLDEGYMDETLMTFPTDTGNSEFHWKAT